MDFFKKNIFILLIIFGGIFWVAPQNLIVGQVGKAQAEIIFSENYDTQTGWNCSNGAFFGFSGTANCPAPSSFGGVTHYAGEITSGGRSGNSLKLWRRNGIWVDYHGYLDKILTPQEFSNQYKELYIRWYVKIDPDWDANLGNGETHKLNRVYIGTSVGSVSDEWYLDVKGATFKTGKLAMYNTGYGGVFRSSQTISQLGINNGQWHSIEWRIKLNSANGSSDGGFQLFINGTAILMCEDVCSENHNNMNMGTSTNDYFTSLAPPAIGNLTDGIWNFPTDSWYAIEFDDYFVSTTYIGNDTTAPNSPTGLSVL